MDTKSSEIHDMIQTFRIECSERAISGLLDILDAMNRRMDEIESETANGIESPESQRSGT